jgi:DNA-binding protein H-NS
MDFDDGLIARSNDEGVRSMATINVDKMSLKDLLELEAKVQKAIINARERERAEIKQKVEAIVQTAGFSVSELFGARGGARGRAVAAKYVNPDDRSQTWTGRGRKPKWLVAKLEKGAKLEDFAVR